MARGMPGGGRAVATSAHNRRCASPWGQKHPRRPERVPRREAPPLRRSARLIRAHGGRARQEDDRCPPSSRTCNTCSNVSAIVVANRPPGARASPTSTGTRQAPRQGGGRAGHRDQLAGGAELGAVGCGGARRLRSGTRRAGGGPAEVGDRGRHHLSRFLCAAPARGVRPLLHLHQQPAALVHPALPLGSRPRTGRSTRQRSPLARGFSCASISWWLTAWSQRARSSSLPPLVFVQDYQLYCVPGMVRAALGQVRIQHFVHIPWPTPQYWTILPKPIRDGLLRGSCSAATWWDSRRAGTRAQFPAHPVTRTPRTLTVDLRGTHRVLRGPRRVGAQLPDQRRRRLPPRPGGE